MVLLSLHGRRRRSRVLSRASPRLGGLLGVGASATVSLGASGAVFGLFAISVLTKLTRPSLRKLLEAIILGQFVVERFLSEAKMATAAGGVGAGGVNHVAHLAGARSRASPSSGCSRACYPPTRREHAQMRTSTRRIETNDTHGGDGGARRSDSRFDSLFSSHKKCTRTPSGRAPRRDSLQFVRLRGGAPSLPSPRFPSYILCSLFGRHIDRAESHLLRRRPRGWRWRTR